MLFAIQVYEQVVLDSLAALDRTRRLVGLRTYKFNAPGQNHGLLLLTAAAARIRLTCLISRDCSR